MSLSIGWITFRLVALDYAFYSMSLAFFSLQGFRLPFFGSTYHFTLLPFTRCFEICSLIMIIFLHSTPITSPIPHSSFDPWFDFRLDAHIFIIER